MNAQIVRQAFNRLLPAWQSVELGESNRLEDARVNLGPCGSANHFVDKILQSGRSLNRRFSRT